MDEAEKLTALKKAYADIILNTAKEAASRIMVTERRAMRFQQELFAAKEDALHMLLRLKQMMDSKITEAEMTFSSQQRKIEELEAQLHEAEDIVSDLRAELREVQDKLEKVNHLPLEEPNLKGYTATLEEEFQENRLHTSDSKILPPMDSQPEPVIVFDVKDSTLNRRNEGNKCQSENESRSENQYVVNPDFGSIMMMNKELELSKNGCTQRICALERDSHSASRYPSYTAEMSSQPGCVEEKLSFSGEAIIREDEKGLHTEPVLDVDICCSLEKEPYELKKAKQADKVKVKKLKRLDLLSGHLDNQVMEMDKASNISSSKTSSHLVNTNVQSGDNPPHINVNEAPKDPESCLASSYSLCTAEMDTKSGCVEVNENKAGFVKSCSTRRITNNDNALIDKVDFNRQENGSAETSVNQVRKMDLGLVNAPLQSDLKTFDVTTNGVSDQPANERLIKYTFQRKRKKESLSSTSGSASLEENSLKRKEEEHHSTLDSQTYSSINESSRYNRRLAQVAHQLISLSGKKWRQ